MKSIASDTFALKANLIYFGVLFIIVLGLIIWDSEAFQRHFRPESYWADKTAHYSHLVKLDEGMLESAYIEAEKLRRTQDLIIYEWMKLAPPGEDAYEFALKRFQMELNAAMADIKIWERKLAKDKENLEAIRKHHKFK